MRVANPATASTGARGANRHPSDRTPATCDQQQPRQQAGRHLDVERRLAGCRPGGCPESRLRARRRGGARSRWQSQGQEARTPGTGQRTRHGRGNRTSASAATDAVTTVVVVSRNDVEPRCHEADPDAGHPDRGKCCRPRGRRTSPSAPGRGAGRVRMRARGARPAAPRGAPQAARGARVDTLAHDWFSHSRQPFPRSALPLGRMEPTHARALGVLDIRLFKLQRGLRLGSRRADRY